MKSFDTRAYSINDFIEWERNNQLELNPRFQRRSVWSDNARSYLMDSIVRGKPIPKVFIRQKINPSTKSSVREVVDGQQRLRTILAYVADAFQINIRHNDKYGGLYFSQLNQVDETVQTNILNYEISVDLLTNLPDSEILDIFGRLNSYAVVLNEQEKLNAINFGPFKTLADELGHIFYGYWVDNKILTDAQVLRMGDVTLVADLLIAMIEGIKAKKQMKYYYGVYEKNFAHDPEDLKNRFDKTLMVISDMFGDTLRASVFRNVSLFYSLFVAICHVIYGISNLSKQPDLLSLANHARIRNMLENIEAIFETEDKNTLSKGERQFLEDSRRATTDAMVRVRRSEFILKCFRQAVGV